MTDDSFIDITEQMEAYNKEFNDKINLKSSIVRPLKFYCNACRSKGKIYNCFDGVYVCQVCKGTGYNDSLAL
jgi:hypothetical protein